MRLDDILNEIIQEVAKGKNIDNFESLIEKLEEHLQKYVLYVIHNIKNSN